MLLLTWTEASSIAPINALFHEIYCWAGLTPLTEEFFARHAIDALPGLVACYRAVLTRWPHQHIFASHSFLGDAHARNIFWSHRRYRGCRINVLHDRRDLC
jgi:hypothetical protein